MDEQDIYNLNDEQPLPRRGSLLVAKPTVGDFFFRRSVVLIINPDENEGAMGVVLNHNSGFVLSQVVDDVTGSDEIPLFLGGPVGHGSLFYLHTLGPEVIPDSETVAPGLWVGGDFDAMKRYINAGGPVEGRIKFVVGYSGWEHNQIEDEIHRHDWAVLHQAPVPVLMDDGGDAIWQQVVSMFGDRYRLWLNLPTDASYN